MQEIEKKIKMLAKEHIENHLLHEELDAIVRASREGKLKIRSHNYSTIMGAWAEGNSYHVTLEMQIEVPSE